MIQYPYKSYQPNLLNNYNNDDRFLFFPFLTGALIGGAAIGLTRPRPIYNVAPQPMPYSVPYSPQMPYANYNYTYYYPNPRPY